MLLLPPWLFFYFFYLLNQSCICRHILILDTQSVMRSFSIWSHGSNKGCRLLLLLLLLKSFWDRVCLSNYSSVIYLLNWMIRRLCNYDWTYGNDVSTLSIYQHNLNDIFYNKHSSPCVWSQMMKTFWEGENEWQMRQTKIYVS